MDLTTTRARADRVAGALADEDSGREILAEAVPEFGSGIWRMLSYEVSEVRKKFGSRMIFCRVSYEACEQTRTADVVAKVYKGDRGAGASRALRRLWEAGFRPPAGSRVPRLYGYSPENRVLLLEKVSGTPWLDFLEGEERDVFTTSARAADWLVRLQGSSVARAGGSDEAAPAPLLFREIASAFPRHASRLEPIAERLALALEPGVAPRVPSHGDYHPENVFIAPGFTSVIDFDVFGRREAAFDVGYAIGQLLIMSYFRTGSFVAGARAALFFWRRYESAGPAAWPRVAVHVARTFLQSLHYELCVLNNGRIELLHTWTDLMEKYVDSQGPETLEDLIRNS